MAPGGGRDFSCSWEKCGKVSGKKRKRKEEKKKKKEKKLPPHPTSNKRLHTESDSSPGVNSRSIASLTCVDTTAFIPMRGHTTVPWPTATRALSSVVP